MWLCTKKVGNDYWKNIIHAVSANFKNGQYEQGIIRAITTIKTTLAFYFSNVDDLTKYLTDEIS